MIAVVFDTETSGLVENRSLALDLQPSVIEFFGCLIDLENGEIIRELELLIKPPKPIDAKITKITTITNELLATAEPFAAHALAISDFIENAPDAQCAIAHNFEFDKTMLEIEYERIGYKPRWPSRLICTVTQTIHYRGYRLSLSNLHEHLFGEPFPGAHRARVDVQALVRCCVELHKRGDL